MQALGRWYRGSFGLALDCSSILKAPGEGDVQAWLVEVICPYPLVGSVVARVSMGFALAMLVIVTMSMMFVAV